MHATSDPTHQESLTQTPQCVVGDSGRGRLDTLLGLGAGGVVALVSTFLDPALQAAGLKGGLQSCGGSVQSSLPTLTLIHWRSYFCPVAAKVTGLVITWKQILHSSSSAPVSITCLGGAGAGSSCCLAFFLGGIYVYLVCYYVLLLTTTL